MDRVPRRVLRLLACLMLIGTPFPGAPLALAAEPPVPRPLEDPASVVALSGYLAGHVTDEVFDSQVYVIEAGSKRAETLVLIHGIGDSASAWYDALPALAARYHVITFDLPGFGRSGPSEVHYSPAAYAAFVEELVRERSRGRFHLVGHSMGAAIAIEVAARMPERVDRLMLLNAAGILEPKALIKELSESALQRKYGESSRFGRWFRETLRGAIQDVPRWADRMARWMLERDAGEAEDSSRRAASALLTHDLGPALDAILAPTLIVAGEDDHVSPPRTAWVLSSRIADAHVEVMPGVGHVPMRAGASFTDLALSWLGGSWREPAARREGSRERDGRCRREKDRVFQGVYREIRIESCRDVTLRGVRAARIVIRGSVVRAEDLVVRGGDFAVSVTGSELTVSGAHLTGDVALESRGSDLDLAGVTFEGTRAAIETPRGTNLICSVCRLESAKGSSRLHASLSLRSGSAL